METTQAYRIHHPSARGKAIVLCDHASNHVPHWVAGGVLGIDVDDMERHIAFDVGAAGLSLALADRLSAPAVLSDFSRLVVDPNRGEDDPTLIMQLYDRTLIPANRYMSAAERQRRVADLYRPYHAAVTNEIDEHLKQSVGQPVLLSIHSFTPQLNGRPPRPWHLGILYADDRRIADPLFDRLAKYPDIVTGDNQPYNGALIGDCMDRHGLQRGLPHVLIEVRNDLIATTDGQRKWATTLAEVLSPILDQSW